MVCVNCKEEFGNGVVQDGKHFCTESCKDEKWRNKGADNYARRESNGLYTNYEDYMENEHDATIVCESENLNRGF